jgi:hypothetical protein
VKRRLFLGTFMTAYWLAQGVGVIAFLIGITTFINRDEPLQHSWRSIAPLSACIFS